jgi:hypothetical protein
MTLGQQQRLFSKLIAELIAWAYDQGYEITLGDAYRDPRVFGPVGTREGYGKASSVHKYRLAMDLNLFLNGNYMTKTVDHKELGEKWESMHDLCRWGGRFSNPDGNHYSMEYRGKM